MSTVSEQLEKLPLGYTLEMTGDFNNLTIVTSNGTSYEGILMAVNVKNDAATFINNISHVAEEVDLSEVFDFVVFDTSGDPFEIPKDMPLVRLPKTAGWSGEAWGSSSGARADEWPNSAFYRVPPGTYLMVTGNFGDATSQTIRQGKLLSVDFEKKLARLESTVYPGRIDEVPLDKSQVKRLEKREGPGALGSVQPGKWHWNGSRWLRNE